MSEISRRGFFSKSAGGAAALATGSSILSAPRYARGGAANDRIVLGLIGAGGRGHALIKGLAQFDGVEVKYVCDVDASRGAGHIRDLEKIQGTAPTRETNMHRVLDDKDVDAVVVATPEHWHALATVWACQAGKDVYVEKHIALGAWDSRKMLEAARKYKRVVQVGTQNRSAPYAFSARRYIQAGQLGKVLYVKVFCMLPSTYGGSPFRQPPDSDPPAGLDWDRWLGPAPKVPYNSGRHGNWYGYWDYSGGSLAADASHSLDLARMVIGDPTHPAAVGCSGGRLLSRDQGNVPEVQIITYDYDGLVMTCENTGFTPYITKSPGDVRYGDKFPHWPQNASRIEIYGTKRMMYLGRHGGGWQAFESGGKVAAEQHGRHPDQHHLPNFIDCIRSRQRPNADIQQGHYSATLVNLGNIAYRTGNQKLVFDPQAERFVGSDEANRLLKVAGRDGYRIPDEV